MPNRLRVVVLGTNWLYAISVLRPRLLISIPAFSGRKFVRSNGLSHSVRPHRFHVNHLPGTVCFEYCCFRSHRKLVRRIQWQARSSCQLRLIFHCLLYCYGVEVRILFRSRVVRSLLISSNSAMFMVFRDHWGKLFNNDPGMVYLLKSQLLDAE